jgi:murein DD-endopeptidase MepM/ murein hydrolase activator NlpD
MHVILVPGKRNGKGQAASLSGRHVAVMAFVGLFVLPALIGVAAYRIVEMRALQNGDPAVVAYREELSQSRAVLAKSREEAVRHLNALALKLGTMQAQVLRLNSLGGRLIRMAGLDAKEFNFDAAPAMGGPERAGSMNASSPDVVKGMESLERELNRSHARLTALESLLLDRKLTAAVTPSAWPVDGSWISSGFGERMDPFTGHQTIHEGIDIAARFGNPIYATGDGVVSMAGEKAGYGSVVELTHESGLATRYAHVSAILVKEGDRVKKGQEIARVGTTGRSTGPHLHFEVLRNGQQVNPSPYLREAMASRTTTVAQVDKAAVKP